MKPATFFRHITFKLWLSIACTLTLTLSLASTAFYYNTQKRFIAFSFDQFIERLAPLEEAIAKVYERDESLDAFQSKPGLWPRIIRQNRRFFIPLRDGPRHTGPKELTKIDKAFSPKKPSRRMRDVYHAQKRFFQTLSLHDKNKEIVSLPKEQTKSIYWHPIKLNGDTIAYFSYEKPESVLKNNEAVFLQQLFHFFTQIAIVMLVVSVILAAVISRWILSPVTKLSNGAREIMQGDLSTRVHHTSKDELGELCQNFNDMCAKLESNEIARRQWVADISHEMRTPVAVLKAQIEAMTDGIRPLTKESLSLLNDKITSLEELINNLYELALSDTGNLNINRSAHDIDALISNFVKDNQARAEQKQLKLTYQSDLSETQQLLIDPLKIQQILHNLFNNSLNYTDSPGEIRWTLSEEKTQFVLRAEDSSPSVPKDEIEKIFERLYRIEKSRSRATGGAGLGLSLSRSIAEAHGGSLSASHSELGGLSFLLSLPKGD